METEHILSYSHGKDSGAAIYVTVEVLGWPLDRIVAADIWATDTIPADPPPMVEFKAEADATIKERWGIEVEHFCARDKNGEKQTYEKLFYHVPVRKPQNAGGATFCKRPEIYGFPMVKGGWCKRLKVNVIHQGLSHAPGELVYQRPQTPGFPKAPLHKGQRKILCNTSA